MRWALALLVTFAFVHGALMAVSVPVFWGPDEDYHFAYIDQVTTGAGFISPTKPAYPAELFAATSATDWESYAAGLLKPRDYDTDPKRAFVTLRSLPSSAQSERFPGRGVGVVHPPLYHAAGALVNKIAGGTSVLTRVALIKWLSSLIAAFAVYGVWLMAAQVFRRPEPAMFVGFVVAVQPMFGFMSGIINHDIAVVAAFNLALAMMLFMLKSGPNPRQGLWLGTALAAALLVKSTALMLLPLAGAVYVAQALVHREHLRSVGRSALIALGAVVFLAGWWYARSLILYGSITGAVAAIAPPGPDPKGIADLPRAIYDWTYITYKSYWFHYDVGETTELSPLRLIPAAIGLVSMIGLAAWVGRHRRELLSPTDPRTRQVALLVAAVLVLYLAIMSADVRRELNGLDFFAPGGRFLIPTFAAAAILMTIGVRQLAGRWTAFALPAVALIAGAFSLRVWERFYLFRYYEPVGLTEIARRMSFDRPEFVTPATLGAAAVIMAAALAGFAVLVMTGRDRRKAGEADRAGGRRRGMTRFRTPAVSPTALETADR